MKTKRSLLLLWWAWLITAAAQAPDTAPELVVEVHSIRSNTGTVRAFAFPSAKGFPSEGTQAVDRTTAGIVNGTALLRFRGLVPGRSYAISLFHDANDDRQMNKNWLGIPREGYGASNDAKATMGPPSFEDARFLFQGSGQRLRIQMRYF